MSRIAAAALYSSHCEVARPPCLEESEYPFMFAHERLHEALEDRAIPYLDLLGSYFGTSPLREGS